jgi:hypothetical protein
MQSAFGISANLNLLSKVKVKNLNANREMEYMIVSEKEADMKLGKISSKSAIGAGLMGKVPALTSQGYGPLQTQLGLAGSIEEGLYVEYGDEIISQAATLLKQSGMGAGEGEVIGMPKFLSKRAFGISKLIGPKLPEKFMPSRKPPNE